MEGVYATKTFGEVSNDLEKTEQPQTPDIPDTPTNTSNTIVAPPDTPATPAVPDANTSPAAPEIPVNIDVSDFNIGIDDDTPATTDSTTPPATFNLDEELKKIDRKELLKKAGVNDFAIEIDEFLSKGGNAIDYLNAKAIDYNKVSDESLIKADLQKQYPTFTPQQIDLMFNRKYAVSEDASDEDREFVNLQMKADAHNSRTLKITEQQKFKIPETPILQKDEAYEQWKQQQESQPQMLEQFRNFYEQHEATKALNQSKRVAINLGDGIPPFNFEISQPEIITKAMTDGGVILNKLTTTQTGEPDVAKQQMIALFSFNPQKFIQDIFNYGRGMGVRKELVEEGQNATRPQAKVLPVNTNQPPTYSTGKFADRQR